MLLITDLEIYKREKKKRRKRKRKSFMKIRKYKKTSKINIFLEKVKDIYFL